MAAPSELSMQSVRQFMLDRGGKVTNHDLVKYFREFLTREDTKVLARQQFKEYVNTLANIQTTDDGEKYLTLKKRYFPIQDVAYYGSPLSTSQQDLGFYGGSMSPGPGSPSPSISGSMLSISQESLLDSPSRVPPPYRPPPPPVSSPRYSPQAAPPPPPAYVQPPPVYSPPVQMIRHVEGQECDPELPPPPVPPRRRSSDKGNKENLLELHKRPKTEGEEAPENKERSASMEKEVPEPKISVKERTQKFNRLASEGDLKPIHIQQLTSTKKSKVDKGADVEYTEPMDAKTREWFVHASRADYQLLAKLAAERPKLAGAKDPYVGYNALHWASKHGDKDIVKLIAGNYHVDPNSRTKGGMTCLHIAMQFGHEEVYQLLVQVYGADQNIRDYSGKKPRQYQINQDTSVSADTFRKIKSRKKHSDKDSGFLRIGSLNVRVKKTTEAFSNFFVGSSSTERLHKTWGSADNIQEIDRQNMPPPKTSGSRNRRRPRRSPSSSSITLRGLGVSTPLLPITQESVSTPSTPHPPRAHSGGPGQDSDSDTACGFGDNWKMTV